MAKHRRVYSVRACEIGEVMNYDELVRVVGVSFSTVSSSVEGQDAREFPSMH